MLKDLGLLKSGKAAKARTDFLRLFSKSRRAVSGVSPVVTRGVKFGTYCPMSKRACSEGMSAEMLGMLTKVTTDTRGFSGSVHLLRRLGRVRRPFRGARVKSSTVTCGEGPVEDREVTSLSECIVVSTLGPTVASTAR